MIHRTSTRIGGYLLTLMLTAAPLSAQPATRFAHEGALRQLEFSVDGKKLTAITAKGIVVWDAVTGDIIRLLATSETNFLLDYSPTGDDLAVYHGGGEIGLWDIATGKRRRLIEIEVEGEGLSTMYSAKLRFAPDGKSLVLHADSASAFLVDLATGKVARQFGGCSQVHDIAFSADGQRLALATLNPSVQVFNPATGNRLHTLDPEKERFTYSICFAKDNRRIAAGGWDRIAVSELGGTKPAVLFKADMEAVTRLAFAGDDRLLVSGSQDGKIRVWDVAARKVLRTYPGYHWALSPDGKTLAVGAERKGAVRFWNVLTGEKRSSGMGDAAK